MILHLLIVHLAWLLHHHHHHVIYLHLHHDHAIKGTQCVRVHHHRICPLPSP